VVDPAFCRFIIARRTVSETPPCLSEIRPLELRSKRASVDWIFERISDSGRPARAMAITFWLVRTSAARAERTPWGNCHGSSAKASSARTTGHAARPLRRGTEFTGRICVLRTAVVKEMLGVL
jgi:hypothetical protein